MSKFRIAEVFGPTIQGEGRHVGVPCHFIRFGGCDFRCQWCDTPHAVLPAQVNELEKRDEWEILDLLFGLEERESPGVRWVVLTGGNPGLFNLGKLIDLLHIRLYRVMLETQGSVYREWFGNVDDLCFSPKPPSAGNITEFSLLDRVLTATFEAQRTCAERDEREAFPLPYLKVPIFTEDDLKYARSVHAQFPMLEMFLSIGNDDAYLPTVGNPHPRPAPEGHAERMRWNLLANFKWVVDTVLNDYPTLQDCRIFPQQHALIWGNARGH